MDSDLPDLKDSANARTSRQRTAPLRLIEWITVGHVALFVIATTWAFGGEADWVRTPLTIWATLGVVVTAAGVRDHVRSHNSDLRLLWWLVPVLAFNALVLIGCLNPSFRSVIIDGDTVFVPDTGRPGWPSVALPGDALQALWVFDVIWNSCFNLAFNVRRRRALRALLLIVGLNALILSIFGTIQRLVGATGIYFGAFPSRQSHFFASFVYHNHWGAFMLLELSIGLGAVWYYARHRQSRDFFHSPAFGALVALLIMAATIPLSTSRSSTVLAVVLLGGAFLHWLLRLIRHRRHYRESVALPIIGGTVAVALAVGGIGFLARDTITARLQLTRDQIDTMRAHDSVGARGLLYRNTWRMAQAKPWFGWGMASYPYVFTLYNTQDSPLDHLPVYYHDAHSDWLQSLAEHGYVGSFLLALSVLLPLLSVRRRHFRTPLVGYPLAGCGLVLLYAWLEFPFGNFAVVLTWWLCFFCAVRYGMLRSGTSVPPT